MNNTNKRLAILSNIEQFAFYGLPDFDQAQRHKYLKFEPQEWKLIESCSSLCNKVYHALQIGYFKAKNTFFKFSNDTTILLDYGYSNGLFCFDFGDTLQTIMPASIIVKDNSLNIIKLDNIQKFCQNSETVGVLYYSTDTVSNSKLYWNSRLYWKDNALFKQAMQIKFPASELEIVKEIIETIKAK